jgi:hypothetical protein
MRAYAGSTEGVGGRRRQALTVMLACAAEWRDAALHCLFQRPHIGGWVAAGEGRRLECEGQCEHGAETYVAAEAIVDYSSASYPTLRSWASPASSPCWTGPGRGPSPLGCGLTTWSLLRRLAARMETMVDAIESRAGGPTRDGAA